MRSSVLESNQKICKAYLLKCNYKLMVNGKVMKWKSSLSANSKLNFIEKLIQKNGIFWHFNPKLNFDQSSLTWILSLIFDLSSNFSMKYFWCIFYFSQYFKFLRVTSLTDFPINSIDYLQCRYYLPLWHLLLKVPYKGRLDNTKIGTDLSTKSFLNLQL